jgi:sugar/nucleoside kinase (ribokinase family)
MQREIPEHINVAASRIAKSCGVITILDMGGNDAPLTHELLEHIDYVSPNQTELVRIVKSIKANHLTESESQMAKELAEGDPRKTGFDFINILREFPEMKVLFKQGEAGSTLMHLTSIGEL